MRNCQCETFAVYINAPIYSWGFNNNRQQKAANISEIGKSAVFACINKQYLCVRNVHISKPMYSCALTFQCPRQPHSPP